MQTTVCARRSLCQSAFGQGFNSPHLHQKGNPPSWRIFFFTSAGVEPEGSRQSVGEGTQSAFFIFGKITQNFIKVFAFLYTKKRKWMLTLDKNRVIAYDRRQDRGAKFISTLPLRSSFSRKPKGNIAEVKSSSCALFAGPSGKTRRTVTQVERYRVQDPSRGPG